LERYGLLGHIHQSIGKLSGGQKQRLAIARTVAMNPRVTCMDEPTSALDPRLTGEVAKLIMEIAQEGRTVLLTTHDIGLVRKLSGKIFLMEGGTIVETTMSEDYFSAPSRYPALAKFLQGQE
jgi:ABC-type polar amino acid transport system ATPase subunit